MAITVIDVEHAGNNTYIGNPQSVTVNKPNGANDDLMVAVIGDFNVSYSLSGWTRVANVVYTDFIDRRLTVLVKRMTDYAGEPSTFTFLASTYPVAKIVCFSLRGVYFADPGYQIVAVGNDYDITRTISGVTTINDNAFVLSIPHWVQYKGLYLPGEGITHWTSDTGAVTDIYVGAGHEALIAAGAYFDGATFSVGFAVGYNVNATAGANISTVWTRYGGSEGGAYGGNSMGIQLVINSEGVASPPCTCHSICTNDCGANQICTGHAPVCSNDYTFTFTPVAGVTLISAFHLRELEDAINLERANTNRRYNASEPAYCTTHIFGDVACTNNAFGQYTFSGGVIGDGVNHLDYDNIKNANNIVVSDSGYGGVVSVDFIAQAADVSSGKIDSVVKAVDIIELQTRINQTRDNCICDSHCNCDATDCGCNGECPNDDYYYYP